MKIKYKYKTTKSINIAYIVLLCLGFLLTIGRWYSVIDNDFVLFNSEIHSHISNFSLSMIVYLCIGYTWLLSGVKFRNIMFFGLFLIISNFICETLMGFMNTTDIIDAIYGAIGVFVVFIFLFISKTYGLRPINSENRELL